MSNSFVINTNMASINGQRNLMKTNDTLSTSMERLSSGLRVNSSKDDAAGLAIGTRMTTQVRGMTVAMRNANDGISMAQTTEGAIGQLTDILQRMRELTIQSANTGAVSGQDREKLNDEFQTMGRELKRTIDNTTFNGLKVLSGGASGKMFQVGWNDTSDNQISITIGNANSIQNSAGFAMADLFGSGLSIGGAAGSGAASAVLLRYGSVMKTIDMSIDKINDTRAKLGAIQNRFSAAISNLSQSIENTTAARSRIMDTDFATETAALSRGQILQQAGTAMLAQANQSTQGVMKLLQ